MKYKEITNKSEKELRTMLAEKQKALREFRFGGAGTAIKNVKTGRGIRKDIARIMTKMNQQ